MFKLKFYVIFVIDTYQISKYLNLNLNQIRCVPVIRISFPIDKR